MALLPRFYPMARHDMGNGNLEGPHGPWGWYVCDALNLDRTNLAIPVADEPCADENEARELAQMLNEKEGDPRDA